MRQPFFRSLLLAGLLLISACSGDIDVSAVFDDTGGLQPGDKVLLAKREVGAVKAIEVVEQAPGFVVELGLYPEHAELIQSNAVAYVPLSSPPTVVLINPTEAATPIAPGGRLRGLSPLEAAMWRANDTAGAVAAVIDQFGRQIDAYFESKDWEQTSAQIEAEIAELASQSSEAAETVVDELERLSASIRDGAAGRAQSLDEELDAIDREVDRLEAEGHKELVSALRRMLGRIEAMTPANAAPPGNASKEN